MTATNAYPLSIETILPKSMLEAQAAICLPEVQEMLQRLSAYGLGVFMPHMHDPITGRFQPPGDELMQVETDLEVSFRPIDQVEIEAGRYLPVGWCWRAGGASPVAACEMASPTDDDALGFVQHKMP